MSGERPPYRRPRSIVTAVGSVATVALLGVALVRWRPSRIEIEGASMVPTLMPGDWALVVDGRRARRGDVFVVEHPGRPGYEIVKRIVGVPGDRIADRLLAADEFWVEGDRPDASTDSRQFGPVRRVHLKARVLLIYWPKERLRRIRGNA